MKLVLIVFIFPTIRAITDSRSNQGLTQFPTDISIDTTKLVLTTNLLTSVDQNQLAHCSLLNYIGIGENNLQSFPNLTLIASSLNKLYLYGNKIVYVDKDLIEALYVITHISLQDNQIVSFPQITQGASFSLIYLNLADNPLTAFPTPVNYTSLEALWLKNTNIQTVPKLWEIKEFLSALRLEATDIANISAKDVSFLDKLETVNIRDLAVQNIPIICIKNIAGLTFYAEGSSLKLCACFNLWLRFAADLGATIKVDDTNCNGQLWSTLNTNTLSQICLPINQSMRQKTGKVVYRGFFCSFPVHSFLFGVHLIHCQHECIKTPGCQAFNFKATSINARKKGDCMILAPAGPNPVLDMADSSKWDFYALE